MKILGVFSAAGFTLPSFLRDWNDSPATEVKCFPPQENAIIYLAKNPDPGQLTQQLVERIGGMAKLIGKDDIVILKVNSQWWYQGMTNTDVLAAFIQLILDQRGFRGEIIIADNHQAEIAEARGWKTPHRNGRFNYNELIAFFNAKGFKNVTKYHWQPAGPNPTPLQFGGSGNSVVSHPSEGDGYVWPENLYYTCPYGNKTILAYPVFTSSFSGVTIDLKNGAFKAGRYTQQTLKFINFSALNHHGFYAGVTASIKNYMGVVDMSCGWPAPNPAGTYNTHHIGVSDLFKWMSGKKKLLGKIPGFHSIYLHPDVFRFRYTGGVLGKFMREIRRADMNIITAVNVGWGARIDPAKSYKADCLIASTDPAALDYWSAENVLLPATRQAAAPDEILRLNDPADGNGVFRQFLEECRRELGGTTNPALMRVVEN